MIVSMTAAPLRRAVTVLTMTAALALPVAASAQSRGDAETDRAMASAVRTLENPATQDALAGVLETFARAMLSMPVRPFTDAMRSVDPDAADSDLPDDATLADAAHVDADALAADMGDQARGSARMMAVMARTVAASAPMWRAMARDMAAQMERAAHERR